MKFSPARLSVGLFSAVLLTVYPARADDRSAELITSGGGEIVLGKSVPGVVRLTGDTAFSFLQGGEGAGVVAAGGQAGKGRVIAFTHGSFLKKGGILDQKAGLDLVLNSMRWTGKSSHPVVGLHPSVAELVGYLKKSGIETKILSPEDVEGDVVDTYCLIGHLDLSDDDLSFLKEFLSRGGGLVISTTPWAFKKKYPNFAKDFPANRLTAAAGIEFQPDGYVSPKTPLLVSQPNPVRSAIQEGLLVAEGKKSGDSKSPVVAAAKRLAAESKKLSAPEKAKLISELEKAKQLRGKDLGAFLVALKELNIAVGPIIPTKENPVIPGRDKLVDTVIDLETYFNLKLPAGMMYAIPAAMDYPGKVESPEKREVRELIIDGKYRGWLSGRTAGGWTAKEMRPTGIYATPGEVIRVSVPARIAGEGFEVVIGSYNGGLNNRDRWSRYPKWMRAEPIGKRVTEVSSGLGGLVDIRVPRGADYAELKISVEGGVQAPLYEFGSTDLNEWKSSIRKYPAPWAELASERMIMAIPSRYIRRLNDPDEVMKIWNDIIDTAAELVSVDRNSYRAERIVFDRLTAAGFMHSGYPMAALTGASAEAAVDARQLRKEGNWGFFHELGHNHQHDLWALPGTGEATCNLWSVYIMEKLIGKNSGDTHGAISEENRRRRVNAYFKGGRNFSEDWNVWTALETYLEVEEEFGWDPFKKVMDEYNHLPEKEWPKTQQEKNDQWVLIVPSLR